ncbi:unnamed protein product [Orchesella dallaii]|uniref:Uncharacterized protein n=1 Tax=Orchesella dallaii TaxID=48710 RepID=A0ABP1PPH6_9HEXA
MEMEGASERVSGEREPEEDLRRQSQSSDKTVSITDSIEDIPDEPVATIDVDISTEDGSSGRSTSRSIYEGESLEWTKRFHNLIDEAPLVQSTVITNAQFQNELYNTEKGKECCEWVDNELLVEGQKFVRRHFFAVLLAHFIGVAFLLTVRPIQSLLLRTSALHRKENTLKRYVKLITFLKRFYESPNIASTVVSSNGKGDATDCQSEISFIRNLQVKSSRNFKIYVPPPWEDLKLSGEEQQIYHAVQEDTSQLTDICSSSKDMPKIFFTVNPDVPISQYDLVIIQFALFGLIAQFPRLFGIYEKCDRDGKCKGIDGFIHLWAVLGRIFGIEDKFNLCIGRNYDAETNRLIFRQVLLLSLKSINESAIRLWRAMTAGSSRYFFFFRTKAMMLFMCKDIAQLENCKHLRSIMRPAETFCYYFYKFLIDWLLWVPPFRMILNSSLRLSIRVCQYFMKRSKKLETQWEDPTVCVIDPKV